MSAARHREASDAGLPGTIAHVTIFEDIAAAEPLWRRLERDDALATPYQRYDWIAPWQRHVGARAGVRPLIVVGTDHSGAPLVLFPLGSTRTGPINVARFLGGKHANFNLAVWRRETAATITADDLNSVLAAIAAAGIDLLALANQPDHWEGVRNPLALLPHQLSPSQGYRGALQADFEALYRTRSSSASRKKMRNKERALAHHGALSYRRVTGAEEVRRVLDVFFAQKAERMREIGVADAFAVPGVHEFLTDAAIAAAGGHPAIEIYSFTVGDAIVATFAGTVATGRFCGMFNSMIRNELAHQSPGDLLLINLVRMCCERGLVTFDLGVGEASYKRLFCDQTETLFDSLLPLTPLGQLAAFTARTGYQLKRRIKQSPAVWSAVQNLRARFGGHSAGE